MLLPVVSCEFLIVFCADLENEFRMLNEMIEIESGKKLGFSTDSVIEIKKIFCEIVRFQRKAKQLSEYEFSNFHHDALYNIQTINFAYFNQLGLHSRPQMFTLEWFRYYFYFLHCSLVRLFWKLMW